MRERALLLGGTLRVDRGVNGIGTTVHACVPVVVPGDEAGGAASGSALDVSAMALPDAVEPVDPGGEEERPKPMRGSDAAHVDLHEQVRDHLRAAQALPPLAAARETAPLMRATHPSADGRTRF